MRKQALIFAAAALLAGAAGCSKNEIDNAGQQKCGSDVAVCAEAVTADGGSKISFGTLYEDASGKHYPVLWDETGETVNLSEFIGTVRSQDKGSDGFSRDAQDHSQASFHFTLEGKTTSGTYDYVAITPQSAARTTGTAAAKKNRASFALAPTVPQLPSAGGPDPAVCIMMACDLGHSSQATALSFHFEHQLAYARMTITGFPALEAGETVSQIKIQAPQGKFLSGRYWYNYSTKKYEEYEGSMADYVLVDPSNAGISGQDFTIWFACLPLSVATGEAITLSAVTSAGRSMSTKAVLGKNIDLAKGRVSAFTVNWQKYQSKTIDFDFTTWPSGWPTKLVNGVEYSYNGYKFTHYGYTNGAASTNRCTHKGTTPDYMVLNGLGFLSLPVVEHHKLVKVDVTHGAAQASTRYGGVVYGLRTLPDSVEFVTAGAKTSATWNVTPGTVVELPILTSLHDHRYWLCCSAAGIGISKLSLTYEYDAGADMTHEKDAITVGNLNIWMPSMRTSKKESGEAPAEREWEYARYNIRDIIKDTGFDILGVQEATLRVRNDVKTDLNSTGKYAYQYFLHKPDDADHSSSAGLIYNKNRLSISQVHQFWLSDTPDVPQSQYDAEGTPRSAGAAVFTDLQTGRRYFVMVAHASLDDGCNAKDGELLVARMKQYNTENLPCMIIGDMNANWNMPLYQSLSRVCDDARFSVELSQSEYMYPGTHNGSAGLEENLKKRANRIDYIFTSGCNVYSYRVNRGRYKAGATMQYPSDHCPPVIKCY